MVNSASNFVKEIYDLGARRIGVFNVPPIGCLPFQRTATGGIERKIVVEYNEAVELYNYKLSKGFDTRRTTEASSGLCSKSS
ncbi:GDSL esterase/lipase EXL3-like [Vicia villosa]|uniref:GDSL esterase/lipase EXL3-like n=1 Tax=Vicia villosa TaxID=3911 RepID=UPI00273B5036|nr:GDSL esterase/lipase EXL3-like [Vicia villosa]